MTGGLPKLVVVLGTTACGKSGLGVELAKRFDGEVISADSRQVYKGLDLGTGHKDDIAAAGAFKQQVFRDFRAGFLRARFILVLPAVFHPRADDFPEIFQHTASPCPSQAFLSIQDSPAHFVSRPRLRPRKPIS